MFSDINSEYKIPLNQVKASPSVNSPNDGAFNSEENVRWANKKLTTKPFIYGNTEQEVSVPFGSGLGVAWYGAYNTDATLSIDGYTIRLANQNELSYDSPSLESGPEVNLMPGQKFVSGLINSGTVDELSADYSSFLFSDYNPDAVPSITPQFAQAWKDAADNGTVIGFAKNTYKDTYLDELNITLTEVKYGTTTIQIDSSLSSISSIDDLVGRSDPAALVTETGGAPSKVEIYYPVKFRKVKSFNFDTNEYEDDVRMYFVDIFGIVFEFDNIRSNTHCYPNTTNQFASMSSNDPLNALSFTSCDLTTIPSSVYDYTALYGSTQPVARVAFDTPISNYGSGSFSSQIIDKVFNVYSISDLIQYIPSGVSADVIPSVHSTIDYYCIKQDSDLSRLCLKVPGTSINVPISFMTSNGEIAPIGFIAGNKISTNYPVEGYLHFIKRLYLMKDNPNIPSEEDIEAVTLQQLLAWTSVSQVPANDGGSPVGMSFSIFFQTYLYPCICFYFNLAYSSLMDNVVYNSGEKMKACGSGFALSSILGIIDNDTFVNQNYSHIGYTNNDGVMEQVNNMIDTVEYHKDFVSDYARVRSNTRIGSGNNIMDNFWYHAKFDWTDTSCIPHYFEDPINLIRRCMPSSDDGTCAYTDSSKTVFFVIDNSSATGQAKMDIDNTSRYIHLDEFLFPEVVGNRASGTGATQDNLFVGLLDSLRHSAINGTKVSDTYGNGVSFAFTLYTWSVSLPYVAYLQKDSLNYLSGKDYTDGKYNGIRFNFKLSIDDVTDDELMLFSYCGSSVVRVVDYDFESFNNKINYSDSDVKTMREAFLHVSKVYDGKKELGQIITDVNASIGSLESTISDIQDEIYNDDSGILKRVSTVENEIGGSDGLSSHVSSLDEAVFDNSTGLITRVSSIENTLDESFRILETGTLSSEDDSNSDVRYTIYGTSLTSGRNICIISGYGTTMLYDRYWDAPYPGEELVVTPLRNKSIYSVKVLPGISNIQNGLFTFDFNDLSICGTIRSISTGFIGADQTHRIGPKYVTIDYGATNITGYLSLQDSRIVSIVIPKTITGGLGGALSFTLFRCSDLKECKVASPLISASGGFQQCSSLKDLTLDETYSILGMPFLGCTSLERIFYLGTKSKWSSIVKSADWDVTGIDASDNVTSRVSKIVCYDGNLVYDESTHSWVDET